MKRNMKKVLGVGAVVALGILAFFGGRLLRDGTPQGKDDGSGVSQSPVMKEKPMLTRGAHSVAVREKKCPPKPILDISIEDDDDDEPKKTPAEKALAEKIEKALDDEDLELARACSLEALQCANVEIRQSMVDTLGWFGEKALAELTPFLADANEDVAESAMNEWEMAVSEIEDDSEKIGTVEMAMQVLSSEDALESISGEYIGVDEKLAVESLLRIIEGGGSAAGIAKAKETYEFVTGDEFTDRAAAEKWIAEEYEPADDGNPQ